MTMYNVGGLLTLAAIIWMGNGLDLTPASQHAGCIRHNAELSVGSKCFAKKEKTFLGKGKKKKHEFIKYIADRCGADVHFDSHQSFETVRQDYTGGLQLGKWVPVTGIAQAGDIIIDHKDMMVVYEQGRNKVILLDGRKVIKSAEKTLWKTINDKFPSGWRENPSFTSAGSDVILPATPHGACDGKSWTPMSVPVGSKLFWKVVKAAMKGVKVLRNYSPNEHTRVYRFIETASSQGDVIAFTAAIANGDSPVEPPISTFTAAEYEILLNEGSTFNANSEFTPPQSGLYFGQLRVSTQSRTGTIMKLVGAGTDLGVERLDERHLDPDKYGRNLLLELDASDVLHVEYTGRIYDSKCTWSMFSMDTAMDPVEAFSLAATSSQTTSGPVGLDFLMFNSGNYQSAPSSYVAPQGGLYFFAVSVGMSANQGVTLSLDRNGDPAQVLKRDSTLHENNDMISIAALLQLNTGDEVTLSLTEGATLSSATYKQTSWLGWYYSPRHGQPQAWSVQATSDWTWATGAPDPYKIPYNEVTINQGALWNAATKEVEISVSGVYYLHINAGIPASKRVSVAVRCSRSAVSQSLPRLYRPGDGLLNGQDAESHGTLAHLLAGDKLWVDHNGGYATYSYLGSDLPLTSFIGMLIYVDE